MEGQVLHPSLVPEQTAARFLGTGVDRKHCQRELMVLGDVDAHLIYEGTFARTGRATDANTESFILPEGCPLEYVFHDMVRLLSVRFSL